MKLGGVFRPINDIQQFNKGANIWANRIHIFGYFQKLNGKMILYNNLIFFCAVAFGDGQRSSSPTLACFTITLKASDSEIFKILKRTKVKHVN
jgi:hypothetical protein